LLLPFGSVIVAATHSWTTVLIIAAVFNVVAALLALLVLKPLRAWEVDRNQRLGPAAPGEPIPVLAT
jgi:OFA family oxalate/formate antiporter-like MFS transporter